MTHDLAAAHLHDFDDLLSTLKTSVYRCMLLSPGSCDMPVHDMAGAANSTGWKVRDKILQLAMPY